MKIESYSDLKTYLRDFINLIDTPHYDSIGVAHLFMAILDNMVKNYFEDDVKSLVCILDDNQKKLLVEINEQILEMDDTKCNEI